MERSDPLNDKNKKTDMISSEEELDKQWKERLQNASVPPPAFVWPEIERALQRKKRRVIGWWSAGSAAVLLTGLLWYRAAVPVSSEQVAPAPTVATEKATLAAADHTAVVAEAVAIPPAKSHEKVNVVDKMDLSLQSVVAEEIFPLARFVQPEGRKDGSLPTVLDRQEKGTSLSLLAGRSPKSLLREQPSLPGWPSGVIRKRKEQTGQCYDFSENRRAWLVEGYLGPLYSKKQLETTGNPEQVVYRDRRRATEGPGWGFTLGGRAAYLFSEKYLFSAGLDYQQFSEVFEYADPSSIEYIIKQVLDVSTNTWKIDTIDINFGEERTRVFNRFGLVDVPVSMGYEWRAGRMGVRLQGGGAANLFFWKRGAILDPQTGVPGYFTPAKGTQSVFRVRAGLSWHAGVQWFWHLAPKTRVFVEPTFRQQLTPLSVTTHPLEQRAQNWSLRVGFSKII